MVLISLRAGARSNVPEIGAAMRVEHTDNATRRGSFLSTGLDSNGLDIAVAYQKRDTSPMETSATNIMPSFDRLLVATDFSTASQAAFRAGLDTCVAVGASLVILHVFEYAESAPPETGGLLLELQVLREKARNALEELRQQAERAGVHCEVILETGIAPSVILEIVAQRSIDLAVLGTNALHGFERLVFGSTAEAVLRKARCPVLTVGPRVGHCSQAGQADGPVIFATDFDFTTIHAIRYAACFANLNGSPLHCLHVLPRTLEAGSQSAIVPSIMAEALQQLAAESGVVIAPPICATTFGSEISHAVVEYAREHKAKMIVLGVRQASLLASHVPEHITYRIITEANCPVLTLAFASHAQSVRATTRR
jgi:nucleotide-binding universal stress UspA family protein